MTDVCLTDCPLIYQALDSSQKPLKEPLQFLDDRLLFHIQAAAEARCRRQKQSISMTVIFRDSSRNELYKTLWFLPV